jgi:L-asparaginase
VFIQIITMGGTIDKVYFDDLSDYEIGEPQVLEALKEGQAAFDYQVKELMRKDSLNMDEADRRALYEAVAACPHKHILITHGTDSMADSARVLMDIKGKVIVFTGALSPYRFKKSDATFNIGCAVGALQSLKQGVYLAMNGLIFPAGLVRKNRAAGKFETMSEAD